MLISMWAVVICNRDWWQMTASLIPAQLVQPIFLNAMGLGFLI